MPTPTVITDLSTVIANNFPAGSNAPQVLDDVQRAHAAFIAQLRDNTGFTGGARAASGANSDITSLTGLTTALSQAQGGTGTALATRQIAQTQVTEFTAAASGSTTIPLDNTKPQLNEGDQYASRAFTAKNTASTLLVEALVNVSHSATTAVLIGAVFDALAGVPGDAVGVGITQNVNNGGVNQLLVRFEIVAGSIAARTFTLRVGSNTAGATYVNQSSSATAILNGTLVSSLRVTEYLP